MRLSIHDLKTKDVRIFEDEEHIMEFSTPVTGNVSNMSTSATDMMSTNVTNSTDCSDKLIAYRRIWMLILFCVFFIFGVFGNGILVLLFFMDKTLRTIHNAFVANMAFSDFLFVLWYVPIKFFEEYSILRPFGKTFCFISIIIRYASQDVSTLSMMALSFYRFLAVMRPLHVKRDEKKIKWFVLMYCAFSWVAGALAATFPATDCTGISVECFIWDWHIVDSFTDNRSHLIFQTLRFVFLFVLPLFVTTTLYSIMACKLCKKPDIFSRKGSISFRRITRSRKKLGGIVLVIVVIFFLSWLPIYLTWFTGLNDTVFIGWLVHLSSVCMFIPATFNPILLFVTSSSYRKPLLGILTRKTIRTSSPVASTGSSLGLYGIRTNAHKRQ